MYNCNINLIVLILCALAFNHLFVHTVRGDTIIKHKNEHNNQLRRLMETNNTVSDQNNVTQLNNEQQNNTDSSDEPDDDNEEQKNIKQLAQLKPAIEFNCDMHHRKFVL